METTSDTIELRLADLAHGGEAVGRHEGLVVFVPFGIPGERVCVQVVERRSNYARARLLEVVEPSPNRMEPRCPHFGVCGGCQLQHVAYEAQLQFKEQVLRSQLQRIGKVSNPPLRQAIGMDIPWAYRNHVQLAVNGEGRTGYLAAYSDRMVPIAECPIMEPLLEGTWKGLQGDLRRAERVVIRAGVNTGERMVIVEGQGPHPPLLCVDAGVSLVYRPAGGRPRPLQGTDHLNELVAGRRFRLSPGSFFQVNTRQAEHLVAVVAGYLEARRGHTVVDVYSGVGLFALAAATEASRVLGIESSVSAWEDARANAAGHPGVEFVRGRAEDVLSAVEGRIDAAILDPPRAGCAPAVLEALADHDVRRLVYVSCDPATLARDVARLEVLGYRLQEVQPVDMFPQTYHVETVALVRRVPS